LGSWTEVVEFGEEFPAHYRRMILFWAATGLRPDELFGLEWRDVDLDARRFYVRRALVDGVVRP